MQTQTRWNERYRDFKFKFDLFVPLARYPPVKNRIKKIKILWKKKPKNKEGTKNYNNFLFFHGDPVRIDGWVGL